MSLTIFWLSHNVDNFGLSPQALIQLVPDPYALSLRFQIKIKFTLKSKKSIQTDMLSNFRGNLY